MMSANALDMVYVSDAVPLLSSKTKFGGVQLPLPANQRQLELAHWFSIEMVALQAAFVDHANGPQYPGLASFLSRPTDNAVVDLDSWKTMCKNQVVPLPYDTSVPCLTSRDDRKSLVRTLRLSPHSESPLSSALAGSSLSSRTHSNR